MLIVFGMNPRTICRWIFFPLIPYMEKDCDICWFKPLLYDNSIKGHSKKKKLYKVKEGEDYFRLK